MTTLDREPSSTAAPNGVVKLLYTPIEAAAALGVSRSTLFALLASQELPSVRIGCCRRIAVDALRTYVARLHGDDHTPGVALGSQNSSVQAS